MRHLSFFTLLSITCLLLLDNSSIAQSMKEDTIRARQLVEAITALDFGEQERLKNLEEANKIYEQYELHEKQTEVLGVLASDYAAIRNFEAAIPYTAQAMRLAKLHLDTLHKSMAMTYRALSVMNHISNSELAIIYGEHYLSMAKPGSYLHTRAWVFLIKDYSNLRVDAEARLKALLDRLYEDIQQKRLPENYITIYYRGMMSLYGFVGLNYEKAIIYARQCVFSNDTTGILYEGIGDVYVQLGILYGKLERLREALKWMKKAYEYEQFEPTDPLLAGYYTLLGRVYFLNNEYEKAIEELKKSIRIYEQDTVLFAQDLSIGYQAMGVCHTALGQREEALNATKRSYEYADNPFTREAYANAFLYIGRYEEGLQMVQGVIGMLFPSIDSEDYRTLRSNPAKDAPVDYFSISALRTKARLLLALGVETSDTILLQHSIATFSLLEFFYNKLMILTRGYGITSLLNNSSFIGTREGTLQAFEKIYELYPTSTNQQNFFEAVQLINANSLLKSWNNAPIAQKIMEQEQELIANYNNIDRKMILKAETYPDSVAIWQQEMFEVDKKIEALIAKFEYEYATGAQDGNSIELPMIQEVQAALQPKEAAIMYYKVDGRLKVITITHDTTFFNVSSKLDVLRVGNMRTKVSELNDLLKDPFIVQRTNRSRFIQLSNELYTELVGTSLGYLDSSITNLVIMPTGALFNLPFEVLLPSKELKPWNELDFLIKKYTISYHYSATTFLETQKRNPVKNGDILAFAPVFDGELASKMRGLDSTSLATVFADTLYRSIQEDGNFSPLPNTEQEVNTIASIIQGDAQLLIKSEATKSALISAATAAPHQFIHIATHGLVNMENPNLSALACAGDEGKVMESLLFIDEIMRENIVTDLVVLSSCESGVGKKITGESPIALNRSFVFAGARNVLFSLQKVEDQYTSQLMTSFYTYYYEGMTYAEALRAAKLDALKDPLDANPHYWAAFVLMGR